MKGALICTIPFLLLIKNNLFIPYHIKGQVAEWILNYLMIE